MTSIPKNAYIDIADKYNNSYHSTIKMKSVDVTNYTNIDFGRKSNCPKFKVDNYARISKCKNIFAKEYTPNWFEEVFVIKKVKILFDVHMLSMTLMVKKPDGFMKKNCRRQIKKNLE